VTPEGCSETDVISGPTTQAALFRQSSHAATEPAERAQTWTEYVPGAVGVQAEDAATL